MLIDAGLDTGPTLLARTAARSATTTRRTCWRRASRASGPGPAARDARRPRRRARSPRVPQDHERATLAPDHPKEDGVIDWSRAGGRDRAPRARLPPLAGHGTTIAGRGLRVLRARVAERRRRRRARVMAVDRGGSRTSPAAAGRGCVLLDVQPESRRAMPAAAFAAGRAPRARRPVGLSGRRPPPRGASALRGPARRGRARRPRSGDRLARARRGGAADRATARFLHELVLGTLRRRGALDARSRPLVDRRRSPSSTRPCAPSCGWARTRSSTCACPTAPRSRSRSSSARPRAPRGAGFVNAVLRRLAREGAPPEPDPEQRSARAG